MRSTLTDKKILITGGVGFIGSALTKTLEKINVNVTILDDMSIGKTAILPSRARLICGSIEDFKLVRTLMQDHDIVFHLATKNIYVSSVIPRKSCMTNVLGTVNVLQAAKECGAERIIYISSASIYGGVNALPTSEDGRFDAICTYSASKIAGEAYCRAYMNFHDLPVTILRYSNVYGPEQHPESPTAGVVIKFIRAILEDIPMILRGNGDQTRDFTFIDDVVKATIAASVSPNAVGESFNVASGRETSIKQLAWTIAKICHTKANFRHEKKIDQINIGRRELNVDKARKQLRWHPSTNLEEGIERTVNWARKQPWLATRNQYADGQ